MPPTRFTMTRTSLPLPKSSLAALINDRAPRLTAKSLCILAMLATGGCAAWSPGARSERAADHDARAIEDGYGPGSNLPPTVPASHYTDPHSSRIAQEG